MIEPGATDSFVNPTFMCGSDVKPDKLSYDLEVRTPTSDQCLITNTIYRNCEIWVRKRKLLVDLISLDIKEYDVVLGMDWLVRYHARLDCRMKMVEFGILREATLRLDLRDRLVSSALISRIRIRKLLIKGA